MKTVNVSIKGISPILMHAYPMVKIEAIEKKTPEEQAELSAYRTPDGKLYIPALNLQRSLVAAAAYSKGKGRASLAKIAAAAIFVSPQYLVLPQKDYIVDARPVVVPATRGRVVRYRPRIDEWEVSFELEYNEALITETQLRKVVDDSGALVGILDFRPACKGPFGRFMVTGWKK